MLRSQTTYPLKNGSLAGESFSFSAHGREPNKSFKLSGPLVTHFAKRQNAHQPSLQLNSTVRWRYEMSKWLTYLSLVSLVFLLGCGYTILKPSVTNGNPSGQDLPSVTVEPDNTVDLYDSLLITEWQGTGKCVDHMALFGGPDFKVVFSLDHTWVLQTDNLSIFGDWQSRISEGKYQVSLTTVGYPRMPRGSCTLSTDGLEMNLRLWGPTQIDCGVSLCPRDHPCAKYY